MQTESFRSSRPRIVGPDELESPYPVRLVGTVQRGFGRGSKDLGCPTANLPVDALSKSTGLTQTGVYYGYAQVQPFCKREDANMAPDQRPLVDDETHVHPMVMSLGYNPFYDNKELAMEVHIMHDFQRDFYGYEMKVVVLGYIRPELNYTSRESLIEDIETDKMVALNSLNRLPYKVFQTDFAFFVGHPHRVNGGT